MKQARRETMSKLSLETQAKLRAEYGNHYLEQWNIDCRENGCRLSYIDYLAECYISWVDFAPQGIYWGDGVSDPYAESGDYDFLQCKQEIDEYLYPERVRVY